METLTISDVQALHVIIEACATKARVRWINPDHRTGIMEGTARYLCVGEDGFPGPDDDIRDCNVRVTTTGGFESFTPVWYVMNQVKNGEWAVD